MDRKQKVSAVFLDIRRAFDAVNVERLLESLSQFGITGGPLELVRKYLTNRRQVVRISDTLSSERSFTQGVVQGSILGPWLFVLFFNSIGSLHLLGKLFIFADDCVLLNTHKKDECVEEKVKLDMLLVINYLSHQKFILNVDKSHFMVFSTQQRTSCDISELRIRSNDSDSIQIELSNVLSKSSLASGFKRAY